MAMNDDTFGDRLKKIRKFKKLSQEKVSEIMGVTALTYARYEKNIRKPDLEFIRKFGSHFDVNFNWLINGDGTAFRDRSIDIERDEEKREELKNLIKKIAQILE